jgi:hypothetical protein
MLPAVGANPGANPTIVSYNSSAVKIYNATGSLVHFENKISTNLKKRSSIHSYYIQQWRYSCKLWSQAYEFEFTTL